MRKIDPLVYVVILHWQNLPQTVECVSSVLRSNYPKLRIMLIDNNSKDDTANIIQNSFPNIVLIRNQENEGFTKGNNKGIRIAMEHGADLVLLLNSDTILDEKCINELVSCVENTENVGLASPIIYYYETPEIPQFIGSKIEWKGLSFIYFNKIREIEDKSICLWGTALIINKELIKEIGLLKEEYFAYWEDTEYCMRSLRAGFANLVCSTGKVYHRNQLGKKPGYFYYYMNRNLILLIDEYIKAGHKKIIPKIRCICDIASRFRWLSSNDSRACLDGLWHGLLKISGEKRDAPPAPSWLIAVVSILSYLYPMLIFDIISLNIVGVYHKVKRFINKPENPS